MQWTVENRLKHCLGHCANPLNLSHVLSEHVSVLGKKKGTDFHAYLHGAVTSLKRAIPQW